MSLDGKVHSFFPFFLFFPASAPWSQSRALFKFEVFVFFVSCALFLVLLLVSVFVFALTLRLC